MSSIRSILLLVCLVFTMPLTFSQAGANAMIPVERHSMRSEVLNEMRSYQVYLPPSYYYSEHGNFPVLYLMDGDYNFYHDSGLIEFLSSVANSIPELIVVGISDKGSTSYRNYCRPNAENDQGGDANAFMAFLAQELKPEIAKNYRTSEYSILVGHSMGGLFVANHYLEQPEGFSAFISIDPSLWWNDYAMSKKAKTLLKGQELTSKLYLSLANTQGMGVREFVGVLDAYFPYDAHWYFKHYPEHTHGSVHMIAIQEALLDLFKGWEVDRETFYGFSSSKDLMAHYKAFNTRFKTTFTLPAYNFANMMNFYYRKDLKADITLLEKEIKSHFPNSLREFYVALGGYQLGAKQFDAAEKTFLKCLLEAPEAFRAHDGLSKVYAAKQQWEPALESAQNAVAFAKKHKARQWQINALESHLESVKAQQKK